MDLTGSKPVRKQRLFLTVSAARLYRSAGRETSVLHLHSNPLSIFTIDKRIKRMSIYAQVSVAVAKVHNNSAGNAMHIRQYDQTSSSDGALINRTRIL